MPETQSSVETTQTPNTPAEVSTETVVINPTESANPSQDVQTPSTPADESLDFKSLMPSAEDRGGLSRREYAKAKAPEETETPNETVYEGEEEVQYMKFKNRLMQEEGSKFEQLNKVAEHTTKTIQRDMEDSFTNALEDKGVSVTDFNSKHKTDFIAKRDEFISKGMTPEDAVKYSLENTLARYEGNQATEKANNRANGRQRARLAPQSTINTQQTTYSQQQLAEVARTNQGEYNRIMDAKENGEIKIV